MYLVKFHRDLTRPLGPQMVVKSKGDPLISGKSRLVKYDNLARCMYSLFYKDVFCNVLVYSVLYYC